MIFHQEAEVLLQILIVDLLENQGIAFICLK
jgi:hypothetical protein